MFAPSGLDAGLLVDGDYMITRPQRGTAPPALVEIENAASLTSESPIAWEDPGTMSPGARCILAEPAPKSGAADFRDDAARHRFPAQFGDRPASQRQTPAGRQLTSQRLDRDHDPGGKSGLDARFVEVRRGRRGVHRENVGATC